MSSVEPLGEQETIRSGDDDSECNLFGGPKIFFFGFQVNAFKETVLNAFTVEMAQAFLVKFSKKKHTMSNPIEHLSFLHFWFSKTSGFRRFPVPTRPKFYLDGVVRMPPTLVGRERFVFRSNIPKTFTDLRATYGVLWWLPGISRGRSTTTPAVCLGRWCWTCAIFTPTTIPNKSVFVSRAVPTVSKAVIETGFKKEIRHLSRLRNGKSSWTRYLLANTSDTN